MEDSWTRKASAGIATQCSRCQHALFSPTHITSFESPVTQASHFLDESMSLREQLSLNKERVRSTLRNSLPCCFLAHPDVQSSSATRLRHNPCKLVSDARPDHQRKLTARDRARLKESHDQLWAAPMQSKWPQQKEFWDRVSHCAAATAHNQASVMPYGANHQRHISKRSCSSSHITMLVLFGIYNRSTCQRGLSLQASRTQLRLKGEMS